MRKNIDLVLQGKVLATQEKNGQYTLNEDILDENSLYVMYKDQHVGNLIENTKTGNYMFTYTQQWIENGFPLSPSLPLIKELDTNSSHNFIKNLLPEGKGLSVLSSMLKISKSNDFGLIRSMEETSGALTFIANPNKKVATNFTEIAKKEMAKRIKNKFNEPIFVWEGKPRISIAGVQDKLPITFIDGKMGLGEGDICSTHILKFEQDNNRNERLVLNEYISLHLARSAGLNIPDNEIIYFEDIAVLSIKRFDRKIIDIRKIEKIHVIDSCQALGVPPFFKYEKPSGLTNKETTNRYGVSINNLADLINQSYQAAKDKNDLIVWVLVNLILGNSDAHGKNITFYCNASGIALAPFYDILNIRMYGTQYNTSLSMAIGDEFNGEKLVSSDFSKFCSNVNIKPSFLKTTFKKVSTIILGELEGSFFKEIDKIDSSFVATYKNDVIKHTERLKEIIGGIDGNMLSKSLVEDVALVNRSKSPRF